MNFRSCVGFSSGCFTVCFQDLDVGKKTRRPLGVLPLASRMLKNSAKSVLWSHRAGSRVYVALPDSDAPLRVLPRSLPTGAPPLVLLARSPLHLSRRNGLSSFLRHLVFRAGGRKVQEEETTNLRLCQPPRDLIPPSETNFN